MTSVRTVAHGTITGIADMRHGSRQCPEQAAYDAFREEHGSVAGYKMGQQRSVPLPDFDFSTDELLIIWTGRTVNGLELRTISDDEIVVHEDIPDHAANICQMMHAGVYTMLAVPRGLQPSVRWV